MRTSGTAGLAATLLLLPAAARAQVVSSPAVDELGSHLARVEIRPEERVVEVVVGPVHLAPDVDHLRLPIQLVEFPLDGWIHGFDVVMRDAAGNELPRQLLHHVNLIDPDHRELFNPTARRVMAAGNETRTQRLPRLLGYPIEEGTRLLVVSMFSNPTAREVENAYLHVRLFYSGESDGLIRARDVYPFYVDVMGPVGAKDFAVPPGRTVQAWEGSPAIDGRLLAIGGHVHRYAEEIRLEDVTEGKVIWRERPRLDGEGGVETIPTRKFLWRLGVPLRKDHVYRAVVEYHNPLEAPAEGGGMGALGGVVWAARGVEWPEFDRSDEQYAADLRNILEAPLRRQHGHGGGETASRETGPEEEREHGDGASERASGGHAHGRTMGGHARGQASGAGAASGAASE